MSVETKPGRVHNLRDALRNLDNVSRRVRAEVRMDAKSEGVTQESISAAITPHVSHEEHGLSEADLPPLREPGKPFNS